VGSGLNAEQAQILTPLLQADPGRPFVVAQLGQSLDGRIATVSGESRYINGEAALDHLHLLRAHVDAVVVGAGTIEADDPRLNVRRGPVRHVPARVVIDPRGRLGTNYKWLQDDGARCLMLTSADVTCGRAEVVRVAPHNGAMRPADIVAALYARGMRKLLIEGGARTISGFIDAGCVDRLHLMVAPLIIGSGKAGLDLAPVPELSRARRPVTRVFPMPGGDVLFDCDLSGT
jgi:diaminohydroxyphosphoribosylaminopyrimidine deaminase/5-amino-6-(5-phosphoribosylamino)uracil reductase